MNITINRQELLEALNLSGRSIGKTALPILANLAFRAAGKHLEITSSDLDVYIRTHVAAQIRQPGEITVPSAKVRAIVNALTSDELELELMEGSARLQIACLGSDFKLCGLEFKEFPPFPKIKNELFRFRMSQWELKEMLQKTAFATSTDDSRFVLNGSLFEFQPDETNENQFKFITVATDGRRLARAETTIMDDGEGRQTPLKSALQSILPAKTVRELIRLLNKQGEVDVALGENSICFSLFGKEKDADGKTQTARHASTLLHSKLVEGAYPDYRQVIPNRTDKPVKIYSEELLNSLRHIAIICDEKCALYFDTSALNLTAQSEDTGEVKEVIELQPHPELLIKLHPKYLIEPLNAIAEEPDVHLFYTDACSPLLIKNPEGNWLCVVMPMGEKKAEEKPAEPPAPLQTELQNPESTIATPNPAAAPL